MASLMVATAILLESSLSFRPGRSQPRELGLYGRPGAHGAAPGWWMAVVPGTAIVLTVLALNMVGEGLNDALNTRLGGRGR